MVSTGCKFCLKFHTNSAPKSPLIFCRLLPPAFKLSEHIAEDVVAQIFGEQGVISRDEAEAIAAYRAIECLMEDAADLFAPFSMSRTERLLDRQDAEALSVADLRIFETPEGSPEKFPMKAFGIIRAVYVCRVSAFMTP